MVKNTEQITHDLKLAQDFLKSMRGRYIISQALYYGLKALKEVQPDVMQEKSNIMDMEYLQQTLFNFPDFVFEKSTPTISLQSYEQVLEEELEQTKDSQKAVDATIQKLQVCYTAADVT